MKDEKEEEARDDKQKKYAEKVKSYTKYETDRKLSKNIELFTKEEIEEGKLELKSSAMMRIVVKWCQELKAAYDSTRQRSEPFRMKDGKEEFININYHRPLHKCLQEEKDKVNDKLKEIMANNFEQQFLLSQDDNLKGIDYFS